MTSEKNRQPISLIHLPAKFFSMQLSKLPILLLFLIVGSTVSAQNRYLEPVFSDVSVTPLTPYGFNYTFLPLLFGGRFTKQPLVMQVYSPVGDTKTDRPLIIYLHTGNFFPFPGNGSCGGAMNDSSNIEFATRLAKMGYVVAVADYRLGWNPFSTNELTRRFTLINGAYRGVCKFVHFGLVFELALIINIHDCILKADAFDTIATESLINAL